MAAINGWTDVFLQPGELYVGRADCRIRTVLGSCVSITLWHPRTCVGGMTHFMLPTRSSATGDVRTLDGRYGDEALQMIFNQFNESGIPLSQCQGKIFGGGNMFASHLLAGVINVGQRNGEAARILLNENDILIVSSCLFGVGHRQIIFDVSNGDVWSKQVKPGEPVRHGWG